MLLEIGYMGRPHGLDGGVVVQLVTTVPGRLAPGSALECAGSRLVVDSAQLLPGARSPKGTHWLVHFGGITTRDQAESLRGHPLRAEALERAQGLWVHELIGAQVVDTAGEGHGTVTAVEANPASDLLVLDGGALVPLHFVVEAVPGRVTVDGPEGLFGP
ncbi:MAG: ribosome maturation factor RimM [Acidimicrobiales bacterium]